MPGWETPYGTVSRAEDYNRWRAMAIAKQRAGAGIQGGPMYTAPPLTYGLPPETVNRWQYPTYQQTPWDPQPRPMPAPVSGGAPPISAGMPLGTRTAEIETPWVAPGTPMLPTTATAAPPVGPWSPGLITPATGGTYPGMRPPALGAYPAGLGTPYPAPATTPSDAYLPLRMKGPWPGGAPAGDAGAGAGAGAGTPATTGAFGPFGSIEDWRNQFYQEHGRWPTDTDAQDAIASFGFLGQTGRSPTQKEWEDRWYGGYGGTTQWGPMGGGYGYGGGGGWAPPPEPSWWGGNVFGEEGWTYLPTGAGQYPYPKPERVEGAADWYNIKDIKAFQQVDPQWRDWLQQAMQSQQQHWEDPLMAPIQWMQPARSEL